MIVKSVEKTTPLVQVGIDRDNLKLPLTSISKNKKNIVVPGLKEGAPRMVIGIFGRRV